MIAKKPGCASSCIFSNLSFFEISDHSILLSSASNMMMMLMTMMMIMMMMRIRTIVLVSRSIRAPPCATMDTQPIQTGTYHSQGKHDDDNDDAVHGDDDAVVDDDDGDEPHQMRWH